MCRNSIEKAMTTNEKNVLKEEFSCWLYCGVSRLKLSLEIVKINVYFERMCHWFNE